MPTRNVVLNDHQADLVERLVSSGRYQNISEVLREGFRLLESRESENAARLEALRSAVQAGIHDISAGRFSGFRYLGGARAPSRRPCRRNPPAETHRPTTQVNAPGAG